MTKKHSTKQALIASVLLLALCFTSLVGTTFAWFTDSVTSANNIIKSGNLDIELEYAVFNADGTFKEWKTVQAASDILTNDLWEPGVTEVAYFRLANAGSLAFKYQFGINIVSETEGVNQAGESFKLSDYIQFGVVEGVNGETGAYANRDAAIAAVAEAKKISAGYTKAGSMVAGADDLYLALVVYMPTSVSNEANHNGVNKPSIELGINVFATQATYEEDSFDSNYDKDAVATIISTSVALPTGSEQATDTVLETTTENSVELTLPKEFLTALAQTANAPESVALSHAEPKFDVTNNRILFEHVELIDENGDIIDLEAIGNDKPITVKFNVGNTFNVGDTVIVYHDGEIFATPVVDADKNITYTATHFCEVTVGYNDGKIDELVELENTIKNANDGDTIVFGGDITSKDGILINSKNLTIDLNGYTFNVSEGASTSSRNFKIIGTSVVTIKNGTIIADGNTNSGAYGTVRTEGTANVTLENLKLYNYRGGGLNVKVVTGTNVTINNCEIYSQYGGGVEASGGTVVLNNTKIEQKGVYDNGWYSVAMEINGGGKITVNSGEYFASAISTDDNAARGNSIAFILSSGGTLNINGGTFNGIVSETADAANFCGLIYADRAAVVNIYGGTFNSNGAILDMRNNAGYAPNPVATIYGGTFSADPTVSGLYSSNLIKLAEGGKMVKYGENYVIGTAVVTNADELKAALANAKDGDVILIANDITVTDAWDSGATNKNITIDGLGNTLKFTNEIFDRNNYSSVFRFTADATVKNLTFDMSEVVKNRSVRMRAISTTGNLTVDGCTFIGNEAYGADEAISVGEGHTAKQTPVTVTVTNSTFDGSWRRAISDNESASREIQSYVITGNTFGAMVNVSAYESITFTGNVVNDGVRVILVSYTNADGVQITKD